MHFERREESRHTGYLVRIDGRALGLPTLLRVSHGGGDAAFNNLKGVAQALGLSVRELLTAEKCKLSRECVLIMLCVSLLDFSFQRRAMLRDKQEGTDGIRAMVESVMLILKELENPIKKPWTGEELKVFTRISTCLKRWELDPLIADAARVLIKLSSRG